MSAELEKFDLKPDGSVCVYRYSDWKILVILNGHFNIFFLLELHSSLTFSA
jgi:hypothetical protein